MFPPPPAHILILLAPVGDTFWGGKGKSTIRNKREKGGKKGAVDR